MVTVLLTDGGTPYSLSILSLRPHSSLASLPIPLRESTIATVSSMILFLDIYNYETLSDDLRIRLKVILECEAPKFTFFLFFCEEASFLEIAKWIVLDISEPKGVEKGITTY